MAEFAAQLPAVDVAAGRSPGFVWRLATSDPMILFNLSVWESVEALKEFTYHGHLAAYRDRARWFGPPAEAYLAMWWIPAGHMSSVEEAWSASRSAASTATQP